MRLYFHLVDRENVILDQEGLEIDDVAQAEIEARRAIDELRQENDAGDWSGWALNVSDASGSVLLSISLDNVSRPN